MWDYFDKCMISVASRSLCICVCVWRRNERDTKIKLSGRKEENAFSFLTLEFGGLVMNNAALASISIMQK